MVNLTLTPHRGNGARTFPSAGYLGLTPVSLAGVARVKIEEDMKPIQASSLVVRVRCYESVGSSATGGNNAGPSSSSSASTSSHSSNSASTSYGTASSLNHPGSSAPSPTGTKGRVLYEQSLTMWLPPSPPTTSTSSTCSTTSSPLSSRSSSLDRSSSSAIFHHAYPPRRESHQSLNHGQEITYGTLGEFAKPWRIVIPPNAVNEGAKSTMIFKNWKVWWAVEAVISHRPLGIHGDRIIKSHQVALLSYATPISPSPPLEWASSPSNPHPLAYHITCSTSTFGSSDPIEVSIQLSKKSLQAETPKRVVLELRREILFHSSDSPKMNTVSSMQASSSKANHPSIPKHSRSHSGNGLASFPSTSTLGGSKYKSESQEALITPPPLSNTSSTLSSFSVLAPTTPPAQVSTPAADYAESIASESYFGLFSSSTSASRKSSIVDLSNTSKRQLHTQHSQQFSPSSVNLSLPAANTLPSKRKKEDITLATFETDCSFTSPTWHGTIKGTMPKAKSIYHYALGETCTTATATSRFYLVPKIQYKNKHSFIELSPIDVTFYTVSMEERKKAEEMKPKIMASQKAEAKLFGSAIGAITSPASVEDMKETKKVNSSKHSSSRQGQPQSSHANGRNRISQSVSPKVGTGKSTQSLPSISTTSTSKDSKQATKETEEEEKVKLSTVRRRSEQAELSLLLDCPRTRQRFGSTPDLSPIVGSPYTDSVSPSLSAISSTSTTRPRTAAGHGHGNGRGSRPTTANSTKSSTARPRSSAGLDSSAWSTYSGSSGHFATFTIDPPLPSSSLLITGETSYTSSSTTTSSSSAQLPPPLILESSMTTSSEESSTDQSPRSASSNEISQESAGTTMKNYTYTPSSSHNITSAAVNGLFADFSGFSLRPPDIMLPHVVPLIREEMIHPKSTTPIPSKTSPNSHAPSAKRVNMTPPTSTSNKRKSTEILLNHDYPHGKIPHSPSLKLSSSSSSASSAVSSPIVALHEITLALPPASISMNPNASSTGNALLLQPNKPRSIPPMTRHDATLEQAAASVIVLDSPAASTSAPGQRRSKGAMSGAFSFFRRSSARI